jgi:hypothetical protein
MRNKSDVVLEERKVIPGNHRSSMSGEKLTLAIVVKVRKFSPNQYGYIRHQEINHESIGSPRSTAFTFKGPFNSKGIWPTVEKALKAGFNWK